MKRPTQKKTNAQKKKAKQKRSQQVNCTKNEKKSLFKALGCLMGLA